MASSLQGQVRDRVGKGAARELRRNQMVPAVIYGDGKDPLPIALPYKEVQMAIFGGGFLTTVMDVEVDGTKHSVLPKDYQLDPVRDFPVHVDLLRIGRKTVVTVEITVDFQNEDASPGLEGGAVLNVVRHTVEVNVPANAIPDSFAVDLTGTELGDSINSSAITLPEGAEFTITDRDFTIATIAPPAGLASQSEDEDGAPEASEVPSEHGAGPDAAESDEDGEVTNTADE